MSDSAILLPQLISYLEETSQGHNPSDVVLPAADFFFRIGLLLSDLEKTNENYRNVGQSFVQLVEAVPRTYLRRLLEDLHEAFLQTLRTSQEDTKSISLDSIHLALLCINGLYSVAKERLLEAAAGHPVAGWSHEKVRLLASVHSKAAIQDDATSEGTSKEILRLSLTLLAIFMEEPDLSLEDYLPAINVLQEAQLPIGVSNELGKKSVWEEFVLFQQSIEPNWKEKLASRFVESAQRDYWLSFFTIEDEDLNVVSAEVRRSNFGDSTLSRKSQGQNKTVNPAEEIKRRVAQIRAILPSLGEGYVETVLSHFQGDVERASHALMEAENGNASILPPAIQSLDRNLPSRWKGPSEEEEEEEARRVTQDVVRRMEDEEEEEARVWEVMLTTQNNYDDDYDDQYDSIDGYVGNDRGLYDDDFDTVRAYNKMARRDEADKAYWDEIRNVNHLARPNTRQNQADDDGEDDGTKRYRGPDKIKGGRIPKPAPGEQGRGGGRGRGKGRGGRGGGGRGRGNNGDAEGNSEKGAQGDSSKNTFTRGQARHKNRKMANRKDKQKQAAAKRST